ncbi:uncharacterized protein N7459_006183 [Penicillium hispanicum]|uniref:uncharacterized protein n=1 Tax=Penicillium hispanicum TaxID=1080232 RepID=UPI002541B2CE|nr:uncharacterized protein N7459_006183 [Penicillium hispanicum]KAJ5580198.1 hypothetical protein N7459_006183 [Penicillium hispanicum]
MTLQDLPLEILDTILRLVGSGSLRKHEACCLLMSKWWYGLAEPILLEDLTLHADQLSCIPAKALVRLGRSVRRLEIDLTPASDRQVDEEFNVNLNEVLSRLLPRFVQLRTFTLLARGYFNPKTPMAPYTDYLGQEFSMKFLEILPFSLLSDLTIDTSGSEITAREHLCPQIAAKIPSLRSLRLRMRCICPRVLEFDHNSKIESIIVNLSLKESYLLNAGFSHHCTEPKSAYDLNDAMVTAATNTAASLPSVKMLRILCHKHPYLDMVTTDCINGSQMVLSDDREWDWSDDGPLCVHDEEPSDRDLFDSDSEDDHIL